ncbi:PLP-dependent aminotransferase family protein [Staphylococcus simulans]|uniref:MocR-like transcriptional regulator GabR n=1 Tax=Staphylococcus simulans TaxID=1286 RepID=UPI001E5D62A9|nr:PLP-dependent aminotransferase family protein [Staphylococcus simulans]MCD8915373.1 PLP-dependent aminotransferase family protein [Staphylococcus simulans]
MKNGSDYIYRKIYTQIKNDILNHKFESHEKLPSKRKLAKELNVSINSVKSAYEQLIAEGYIYTLERKGYFIESLNALIIDQAYQQVTENLETNDNFKKQFNYTLSHMSTNLSEFPIDIWIKMQKKIFREQSSILSEVPYIKGPIQLRNSLAKIISFKRGISCNPEQIILGSGTNALMLLLLKIFDQKLTVGVENPGYSRMRRLIEGQNIKTVGISINNKGVSVKMIQNKNPEIMLTTPSHQFPLGVIMPISRRIELLNWATQHQNYIIEDDYDSEYKYGTDNIPSLFSLDKNNRVIYLGTFSKTLLPGMRISYMILPPVLLEKFNHIYDDAVSDISTLNALTLSKFIDEGEYEKYIKKMSHTYEFKRKKMVRLIKQKLKQPVTIKDIKAGLHFVIEVKSNYTYAEVEERASQNSLELYTLRRFMVEDISNHKAKVIIIGFANINDDKMEATIDILNHVLFDH